MNIFKKKKVEAFMEDSPTSVHRRTFLKYSGMTLGAAGLFIAGCNNDDDGPAPDQGEGVNLGSGDVGVLNYAYALEQLEAAFYTMVVAHAGFNTAFSNQSERDIMQAIRDHEVIHREFFKTALGSSAIQDLEVDFSSVDFSSRSSVLNTAKTFEDLGVSAYNGAGQLLSNVNNLLIAGKIVSVEARHASVIRDLLMPKNAAQGFAGDDVINDQGLDVSRTPAEVLAAADPFIVTQINASNLPTA